MSDIVADEGTGLSIGQVAERTGLSVHALRFYEREGVLGKAVRRGPGGHRVYGEDDVEWLNMCVMLRATGMPLPDIRRYTQLARQGPGTEEARAALLRRHQERVADQMAQLGRCLDLISHKVRMYEDILTQGPAPTHPCQIVPSA
jgi:DNA-binding transcriptional MerR regulator